MQQDPATDWMYTADPGRAGLGLNGRRTPVPRGKMLGGSSGINYMAYVRGHPGDFDAWAEAGAEGWSYADVLPYFRKSECLAPSEAIPIDPAAHGTSGPLGVSVRSPVLPGAREFVAAAEAAGIPRGDYNGRDRGGARGAVSLMQTSTKTGKRSSTYHAFLEGDAERRPNLTIVTGAQATRVLLSDSLRATGVEYRTTSGETRVASAAKEVIVCAGAVGSPHLLLLSGIGPRVELRAAGVKCLVDSSHVGKHLQDHLQVPLFFASPTSGLPMRDVAAALDDDRQMDAWRKTGQGLMASSLYDAGAWFSTGFGDLHSHDAQIGFVPCAYDYTLWHDRLNVDTAQFFDDVARRLAEDARGMIVLANPVLPHSEGEIVLESADPDVHPAIRLNYYGDPHDLKVVVAVLRRALDIVAHWPKGSRPGTWVVPPALAAKSWLPGWHAADRRAAEGPRVALLAHRLPPELHLPDRRRGRSPPPGARGGGTARRRRERHATRRQRQHQCGVDHDRREGRRADRGRPRRRAARGRRQIARAGAPRRLPSLTQMTLDRPNPPSQPTREKMRAAEGQVVRRLETRAVECRCASRIRLLRHRHPNVLSRTRGAHFHAEYQGQQATFTLEGNLLAGALSSRTARRLITEWAVAHRTELQANWDRLQEGEPLERIAPPGVRLSMAFLPMVIGAEYRGDFRIHLVFNDGVEETVDFSAWLEGPVFQPLKDQAYFCRFFPEGGTVAWPNGADIAPETLHERAKASAAA